MIVMQPMPLPVNAGYLGPVPGLPTNAGADPNNRQAPIRLTSSISTILRIPKIHQVDCLQKMDSFLDSTLIGKCDSQELVVIVWLFTRIKPGFKIADMRCDDYDATVDHQMESNAKLKSLNGLVLQVIESLLFCLAQVC